LEVRREAATATAVATVPPGLAGSVRALPDGGSQWRCESAPPGARLGLRVRRGAAEERSASLAPLVGCEVPSRGDPRIDVPGVPTSRLGRLLELDRDFATLSE
jgi:hypothetical protein